MRNKIFIFLILIAILVPVGCTPTPAPVTPAAPIQTVAPAVTETPDLCSPVNVRIGVTKVHELTREFDDYAKLASNLTQAQLLQLIPSMQAVSRRAQSQAVPACLKTLKILQLNYMDTVDNTLIAFMGNTNTQQISTGIAQGRSLHQQYDVEAARLLGITLAPQPSSTPGASASAPASDTPATAASPSAATAAPSTATITNPGPNLINLRASPNFNATAKATLAKGLTAAAIGVTADGQWIEVEIPGKPGEKAWCYASNVQVTGKLPIVTP
jgi:hypothetical protein